MKSLIYELQEDAYNSKIGISSLLRKACVVARKLQIKDFDIWLKNELNGYTCHPEDVPEYRRISGEIKAWNPLYGWIPCIFKDTEIVEILSNKKIGQPVTEIEVLTTADGNTLAIGYPQEIENQLSALSNFPTKYHLQFSKSQAEKILQTVRNIVLDWALKLEEDGILGEGISFSKEEKEVASEKGYTVNNFYGPLHNTQIQQHSNHSTQNMQVETLDLEKLKTLVGVIQDNLKGINLKNSEQDLVEKELSKISDEIQSPKPNAGLVQKSLKTIGSVLEKVTSSLIASGIIHEISKFVT